MKNTHILILAALLFICLPSSLAFWRLPCSKPVSIQRADPIVSNGTVGLHVHTIMGASGFHSRASSESIRQSKCSTCLVKEDMSNYWIATLFYQHANGTMESVPQNGGMLVYYLQRRGEKGEKLRAFPYGLRMVAGDPDKRSGTNLKTDKAISYACINYEKASKQTGAFPQKNCPQGLRVQVFFPSCWDGKNLDSPDHSSHMAYPSGVNSGKCPPTHPVRLISIFYEVYYKVDHLKNGWLDKSGKPFRAMPFFWSTGDNTGFGHHGDFLNGWNVNTLQKAVDDCTDSSGSVKKCQHFTFRTKEEASACRPEFAPVSDEKLTGMMDQIPNVGKIPVAKFDPCGVSPNQGFDGTTAGVPLGTCKGTFTNKPAYTPVSGNHLSHEEKPAPATTKAANPIDQTGYLGCYETSRKNLEKKIGNGYTPATCRKATIALGSDYVVFGVSFGGECWASTSNTSYKNSGTSTHCTMACKADTSGFTMCGGRKAAQVYTVKV